MFFIPNIAYILGFVVGERDNIPTRFISTYFVFTHKTGGERSMLSLNK